MSSNGRYYIGKVGISAVDMDLALSTLDRQIQQGPGAYVCVANVRTVVLSQSDSEYCHIQNHSLMTLPDGMPLVWAARVAGLPDVQRVTGPDLMLKILSLSAERGYSHFFFGETPETLARVVETVKAQYPGIDIRGHISPPFAPWTARQATLVADEINKTKPTFVWVALGAPKQERWMAQVVDQIDKSILLGVGAAFRFVTGEHKHPPMFVQKMGLEGLYWRFRHNPVREIGWYCRHVPAYGALLGQVLADRLRGRQA